MTLLECSPHEERFTCSERCAVVELKGIRTPDLLVAKAPPASAPVVHQCAFGCIACIARVGVAGPEHTGSTRGLTSSMPSQFAGSTFRLAPSSAPAGTPFAGPPPPSAHLGDHDEGQLMGAAGALTRPRPRQRYPVGRTPRIPAMVASLRERLQGKL